MRATVMTAACLFLLASASAQQGKPKTALPTGKAVLEAYVSAWNHHDFAALEKLLTPDAVHEDVAQGVHAQGLAEIKKFMREEIEGEPDLDWRLTTVVQAGPVVAAEWTWTGTYTGEGPTGYVKAKRISGRGASVVLIEDGRIKRFTDYYDFASFFPKPTTADNSQPDTKARNRLTGTWRLVSAGTFRRDGGFEPYPEYGPHPIGYLIYDPTGHMCVSLSNPNHPHWADPEKPTEGEKLHSYDAFFAYCGRYEIREKEGRVIHRPEMASWPHYISTDQNRNFRLEGDRLILSDEETPPGGERRRYQITWERVTE